MRAPLWTSFALAALVVAVLAGARLGSAEDKPPSEQGGMSPMPKLDHALAKALDGTWAIATKSALGNSAGTTKFAIGVGGTALLQDYESRGPMGAYEAHGVWKVSGDGKALSVWWFDTHRATPQHFTGSLTEAGYDLKTTAGMRIVLAQQEAGFQFQLFMPDGSLAFTDTYTRK